ncbi:MAG TPA: Ig-like domain-containing protein [Gemmatimonadales bacterium]|nr:Ig-like domain-containing protein [Gemmatimonadales bacterium]
MYPAPRVSMSPLPRLAVAVLALTMVAACSDSATDDDPKPPAEVASIVIEQTGPLGFASLGLTETLTATARDAEGNPLTVTISWTSQNQSIASVSAAGVVTSKANGSTTITASAGNKNASIGVDVAQVPATMVVEASATTLTLAGMKSTVTATVRDGNDRTIADSPVTWSSSDEAVLAIDEQGKAAAVGMGKATITATSGSESASVDITVKYTGALGDALVGQALPCTGGMAGPFPCQGVTLMSYLPNSGVGGDPNAYDLNDMWGWVDPQTQREYVIQMRRDGAAFIDITDPVRPRYLGQLLIPGRASQCLA